MSKLRAEKACILLSVALTDDDPSFLDTLSSYLEKYAREHGVSFHISRFTNGYDLLESKESYDIVFLDIQMPGINGLDLARKLRKIDENFLLIFITQFGNLAVKGYEVDALDFLIKPLNYFEFKVKFEKAYRIYQRKQSETILLTDKEGNVHRMRYGEIRYIEVSGHNVLVHTEKGVIEVYGSLKKILSELGSDNFMQINRFYLVNLEFVTEVNVKESLVYLGNEKLQISRRKMKDIVEALSRLAGGRIS